MYNETLDSIVSLFPRNYQINSTSLETFIFS